MVIRRRETWPNMTNPFHIVRNGEIPAVDFASFYEHMVWNQGEHMAMIGPTGQGKTNLFMLLESLRTYVTIFATKPRDERLDIFESALKYKKLTEWKPKLSTEKYPKRILWPHATSLRQSRANQTRVFGPALDDIFGQGSWTVYFDELWWMSYILKFSEDAKIFLQQGRSLDLSFVCATQRPAWVPLEIYDMSTHLFFWADNDRTNLNRISSIGSFDSDLIRAKVATLRRHEVLYINTRDHFMCTFIPPLVVLKSKGGK